MSADYSWLNVRCLPDTHTRAYHTFARGLLEMPANSLSEQQGVAFTSEMPRVSQEASARERGLELEWGGGKRTRV